MDWFLYDIGLGRESVNQKLLCIVNLWAKMFLIWKTLSFSFDSWFSTPEASLYKVPLLSVSFGFLVFSGNMKKKHWSEID